MLNKRFRLNRNSQFTATYKVRHSFYLDGVAVFVGQKKKYDSDTRVGFVVSKKTHKRAVKRNRLKRLMRESYRLLLKENGLGNSQEYMSLIFVGHARALQTDFFQMKGVIERLLLKIND